MKNKKYKILMISGYPPSRSANLAQDVITALEEDGHEVDFLTTYSFPGQKKNQYNIYPMPLWDRVKALQKYIPFQKVGKKIAKFLLHNPDDSKAKVCHGGYVIHHLDEANPPVPLDVLAANLPDKKYDFIYIMIVQRLLTTASLLTIYDKYKAPFFIVGVDMLHMTGGCYFFGKCERFGKGCGMCPVLDSNDPNDITRQNYLMKKEVFSKIPFAYKGNLHQSKFALKSGLFKEEDIALGTILIDETKFKPYDIQECRKQFNIPAEKEFVILSRYEGRLSRMKGYDHMINILNIFSDSLTEEQRKKCLFVMIGSQDEEYASQIKLDTLAPGYLNIDNLIRIYSAASVFISTSIDDAGPSMVNQSMMCGTPVVSFSIGTALQVTREGISGYMTPNYDDKAFADAIHKIFSLDKDSYQHFRQTARETALELNSKSANAKRIIEIYEDICKRYGLEVGGKDVSS